MKTNKELKSAYKLKKPDAGVFQVQNKKSGKVLIEGATNMSSKWNRHRTELRFGTHRNKALQTDWNEVKEENFQYSVLSALDIKEDDNFDITTLISTVK